MKNRINWLFSDVNVTSYINWIIKFRYLILGFALLLTIASIICDMKICVDSSIMALLKKDTPAVQRISEVEKRTGGFGDLIVMIESENKNASVTAAESLLPSIRALPWVADASYKIDDSLLLKKKLLFVDINDLKEIKERVKNYITGKTKAANPLFVSLLDETSEKKLDLSDIEQKYAKKSSYRRQNISDDGKMLLIVIHPSGITSDISFAKKIYKDLDDLILSFSNNYDDKSVKFSIGGTYKNRLNEYDTIIDDLSNGTFLGVSIILLLLFCYFRRLSLVICVLIPLIMSETWTFALTALTIGDLNLITAFLIIILFGLGIDFGIHQINRYMIIRRGGGDHLLALKTAIQTSGRASLTSGLTVVVSFYMLMFSNFLGFRHFGFIAGTGILLAYIAYIVLIPALLTVANDITRDFGIHKKNCNSNLLKSHSTLSHSKNLNIPIAGAVSIAIVTIAAIVMLRKVGFEYDFRNLRSQIQSTREFNQKMRKVFSAARDPAVVMVANAQEADAVEQYIRNNGFLNDTSVVEDVKSISSIIPQNQDEKIAVIKEIKDLLDRNIKNLSDEQVKKVNSMASMLVTEPITEADIPNDILKLFKGVDSTDGQLMYIYQRYSLLDLHNAEAFSKAVGKMTINNKDYYAISEPLVYVDLISLLKRDSLIAIIAAFIIIASIVFSDFWKLSSTIIILAPLCIGIVWMLGIMGIMSLKLNIFNMVILPSILGLGVDAGVHIYHQFHRDSVSPIGKLLVETGGPNFLCTLINLVGFGGIVTANHPGLRSIGELAIIGMSTCLVASLTIIPVIMSFQRKRNLT